MGKSKPEVSTPRARSPETVPELSRRRAHTPQTQTRLHFSHLRSPRSRSLILPRPACSPKLQTGFSFPTFASPNPKPDSPFAQRAGRRPFPVSPLTQGEGRSPFPVSPQPLKTAQDRSDSGGSALRITLIKGPRSPGAIEGAGGCGAGCDQGRRARSPQAQGRPRRRAAALAPGATIVPTASRLFEASDEASTFRDGVTQDKRPLMLKPSSRATRSCGLTQSPSEASKRRPFPVAPGASLGRPYGRRPYAWGGWTVKTGRRG